MQFSGTLAALTDLVLPRACIGCGQPGSLLCRRCVPPGPPRVVVTAGGLRVHAAADYADAVRTALLAYKERGRRDLVGPLAVVLAGAVRNVAGSTGDGVVLVPVPSTRAAARRRGGDHLRRLTRAVGRRTAIPAFTALRLIRPVLDSAGLTVSQRAENIRGAMAAAAPGRGVRGAVLVDDIVTTAATLGEAARALRAGGWSVLGAAVVAATPRRAPAPSLAPRRAAG